ncbi:MAG: hypothetical protein ACFFDH_09800 [Promethearchaeota archaeon]
MLTYKDMPSDWENWYHLAKGFATEFIELCLDKKVNDIYLKKSWKGEGWTKVRFSWSF